MPRITRQPLHSGTWYDDDATTLGESIDRWLQAADVPSGAHARAIIAPHAGYRYCGHVMAYAYKQIDPKSVTRVFLLGPSHHVYTRKCHLSPADHYETPLGSVEVDSGVYQQLRATGQFEFMDLEVDEAEHSLELHMPYIMRVMGEHAFKLVPIMVGALSAESEAQYGQLLGSYLDDPGNLFIISSDFCHWGSRFNFTFWERAQGPLFKSIEWLDRMGMDIIEQGDPRAFTQYLRQYNNTICGRHPIGVFLNMLENCHTRFIIRFQHYDQSSRCSSLHDSSVSYAAAVVLPAP